MNYNLTRGRGAARGALGVASACLTQEPLVWQECIADRCGHSGQGCASDVSPGRSSGLRGSEGHVGRGAGEGAGFMAPEGGVIPRSPSQAQS